jgi:FixJ family two-component response regulator
MMTDLGTRSAAGGAGGVALVPGALPVRTDAIIHIVDDDRSYRMAIGRLLEASGFRVASYASGEEILARLPTSDPGCVLLDLQMPGVGGLELQRQLRDLAPGLPIIFLTGHADIPSTVQAMKAGAAEFLEKTASSTQLLEAVERALASYEQRHCESDRIRAMESRVASLTPRETEVFGLIIRGKRNKQIAYALGTSERTVKAHRRSVMEKLGVQSLAEAVSIGERLGLLGADA